MIRLVRSTVKLPTSQALTLRPQAVARQQAIPSAPKPFEALGCQAGSRGPLSVQSISSQATFKPLTLGLPALQLINRSVFQPHVTGLRALAEMPGGDPADFRKQQGSVPVTTQQNMPAQDPWQPVVDPKSGGTYYWNTLTNETTMVGEPKPTTMYRQPVHPQHQPQTFGQAVGGMVLWGFGITLGFAFVGALGRMLFG